MRVPLFLPSRPLLPERSCIDLVHIYVHVHVCACGKFSPFPPPPGVVLNKTNIPSGYLNFPLGGVLLQNNKPLPRGETK